MAKRFVVYGRVQGVGFRYFTWKEAERIGIKGTVRNCTDGSVEIIAEGNDDQLQDFYDWLKVGPRTASVERVLVDNIEDKRILTFRLFIVKTDRTLQCELMLVEYAACL